MRMIGLVKSCDVIGKKQMAMTRGAYLQDGSSATKPISNRRGADGLCQAQRAARFVGIARKS
jgi:hypothetical protein